MKKSNKIISILYVLLPTASNVSIMIDRGARQAIFASHTIRSFQYPGNTDSIHNAMTFASCLKATIGISFDTVTNFFEIQN